MYLLRHEEGEPNDEGSQRIAFMLLNSHEVDCEHQLHGEESLDEQTLGDGGVVAKLRLNDVGAGEDTLHHSRGHNGTEDLTAGQEDALYPVHLSNKTHSKGDLKPSLLASAW